MDHRDIAFYPHGRSIVASRLAGPWSSVPATAPKDTRTRLTRALLLLLVLGVGLLGCAKRDPSTTGAVAPAAADKAPVPTSRVDLRDEARLIVEEHCGAGRDLASEPPYQLTDPRLAARLELVRRFALDPEGSACPGLAIWRLRPETR